MSVKGNYRENLERTRWINPKSVIPYRCGNCGEVCPNWLRSTNKKLRLLCKACEIVAWAEERREEEKKNEKE